MCACNYVATAAGPVVSTEEVAQLAVALVKADSVCAPLIAGVVPSRTLIHI